ncbi:MAG: N-acetyltransferase [Bacteroidales bacterium]|nr:N-acetyltransferase [Bacteroidales bacterium]
MASGRNILQARASRLPRIMEVLSAAKKIMRSAGNLNQWTGGYPSEEAILGDIEKGCGYVVEDEGNVVGYFAFVPSPEPTYKSIYEGKWVDDSLPYHVIHRIGSFPEVHGVFKSIMDWCFSQDPNIRIDTHRDNRIMQHLILKEGFTYCGIIYLANGDERLAYQKIL